MTFVIVAGDGKRKGVKMKCDHKSYEVKIVMGMQFCVCRNCGFQWKGNKPYKTTSKQAKYQAEYRLKKGKPFQVFVDHGTAIILEQARLLYNKTYDELINEAIHETYCIKPLKLRQIKAPNPPVS